METLSVALALLLGAAIKQTLAIIAATLCIYFGYRLFYITEQKTGNFEASAKWGKLKLSQAAPGIFFTLFGCVVLIVALETSSSFNSSEPKALAGVVGQSVADPTAKAEGNQMHVVSARGASATSPQTMDWRLCGKSANYARNLLRSEREYGDAGSTRGKFLRQREDGLERMTAYCVDQALGQNSYARYARAEELGAADGRDEDKKAHDAVDAMLSE